LPVFCERLAEEREQTGADPVPELRQAARLEPSNPERWLRLGTAAEWSGDSELAGACLRRAAELSRLYQPRYLLAQYYFRRQNSSAFFEWAQAAFQMAYGDVSPLLDLCRRMQPDGESFARQALSSPARVRRQFLLFLVRRGETEAAATLASTLSENASAEDLAALYGFCNLALAKGDVSAAAGVWNALCRRGLTPYRPVVPEAGASLTNSDFRRPALAAGFDWHVEPAPGIRIAQLAGEWRAAFSGDEPESCLLAWQYVPLVPKHRYRLRIDAVPLDESSTAGIGWSLWYPAPDGRWTEWIPGDGPMFTAQAAVARLTLTYRRPLGSPRLDGTVAIRQVRLEPAP
jgi:tetratricopeptide (TPR) repeat protein